VIDLEQGVAQLTGHALDDAAGEQELAHLDGLFLQNRRAQVTRYLDMGTVEFVNVVARLQRREQGELDTGDPTFSASENAQRLIARQRACAEFVSQLQDRRQVEVEISGVQGGELFVQAQLAQMQRWHAAPTEHPANIRRRASQQRVQSLDRGRRSQALQVIEHDHERRFDAAKAGAERRLGIAAMRNVSIERRAHAAHGCEQIGEEPHRIIVELIERQPRHRLIARCAVMPLRQQRSLAGADRRRQQRELLFRGLVESRE
jgi:hypothetical protein